MTNTKKTIDISELPVTDRLTIGRKLDKNNGPILYMGCTVVVGTAQKAKDTGPRTRGQLLHALTEARLSKTPKPKAVAEEDAPRGAFVAGEGFVWFDETN